MEWILTEDVEEFLAAAEGFLRSQRAQNTVLLTASETLRIRGPGMFGAGTPLFGWWGEAGAVAGALLDTPPFPLLLSRMPEEALAPLAVALAERARRLSGVNAAAGAAEVFAAAWEERTAVTAKPHRRQRLYRLTELVEPDPLPPGRPVVAGAEHRALLVEWHEAFVRELDEAAPNPANLVDDRLDFGGLTLWEVHGEPVAMAGVTRQVAAMARVAPVYTPPDQRRRGYAGAVTAAVTQGALDAGAEEVLLFTDLDNPSSNSLYQQLGYRAVEDRVVLLFRE